MEPPNGPDLPQFRLVDMFTSGTHPSVREDIIESFTKLDSPLRVLIATVAFEMGVNPPDVRLILQHGPPNDMETYIQETGRGGRDGLPTYAVMRYGKGLKRNVDRTMISDCVNSDTL